MLTPSSESRCMISLEKETPDLDFFMPVVVVGWAANDSLGASVIVLPTVVLRAASPEARPATSTDSPNLPPV